MILLLKTQNDEVRPHHRVSSFSLQGKPLLGIQWLNPHGGSILPASFRLPLPCCGGQIAGEGSLYRTCPRCGDYFGSLHVRKLRLATAEVGLAYDRGIIGRFLSYHLAQRYPQWTLLEISLTIEDILLNVDGALAHRLAHGQWYIPSPNFSFRGVGQ